MVSLGDREQALITGLTACLAIAVRGSDNYTLQDLNQTKTQKLVYLAAKEFDFDITYSWYLAGSYAAGADDGYQQVNSAFDTLPSPPSPEGPQGPSPSDSSAASESEAEIPEIQREFEMEQEADDQLGSDTEPESEPESEPMMDMTPSSAAASLGTNDWMDDAAKSVIPEDVTLPVDEIVAFYRKVLRQYPLHPTDRFLQQFYHYHAPDAYADLYEHCLHLRSVLREVANAVEDIVTGTATSTDFERHSEEFGLHLSDFHLQLYAIEELAETADAVVAATEPIEEALIKLAAIEPQSLDDEHLAAVKRLQDYFYTSVWRYPALRISVETATGPGATEIVDKHEAIYHDFESTLEEERESMREQLAAVNLLPNAGDYPPVDDEALKSAIGDLMSVYNSTIPQDGE